MNSLEFTTLINTLPNSLACYMTNEEISILAVTLTQLADTLATIAILEESNNKEVKK